jgi:Ca-activated chloride channel family protein
MQLKSLTFALGLGFLGGFNAVAETPAEPKLLIIYDSSNSMWGELSDASRKYEEGRTALANLLDSDLGGRDIGFRAYGHRDPQDCQDTELMVPFGPADARASEISTAVSSIRPTGKTPITFSLTEGLKDLGDSRGDILLITDGLETCDADPCDLVRAWSDTGIDIKVHVVGIGLNTVEQAAMQCLTAATDGTYLDAQSAATLTAALEDIGELVAQPEAVQPEPEPEPAPVNEIYRVRVQVQDANGREYPPEGFVVLPDGTQKPLTTGGIAVVGNEGGSYPVQVGVRLADGTVYEPVDVTAEITDPGTTDITVEVQPPARVIVKFIEKGEPHPGALVTATLGREPSFSFRPDRIALVRPGHYQLRTQPNADNDLTTMANMLADETTEVVFDLTRVVKFNVRYELPDGSIYRRSSSLYRDGEEAYRLHKTNSVDVKPGTYELRSDDLLLPFPPRNIEVTGREDFVVLPMPAGFLRVNYADQPQNYVVKPGRAFIAPGGGSQTAYAGLDALIPVAPGDYVVQPHDRVGFVDPVSVSVANGETVDVTLTPMPLGAVRVVYAENANYETPPNRASIKPLDGQPFKNLFLSLGTDYRVLPGRYLVEGWAAAGDFTPVEVTVTAGTVTDVVLTLAE